MVVTVKFFSILKQHAGVESYAADVTSAFPLRALLKDVHHRFFENTDLLFTSQNLDLNPTLLLMVDGCDYRLLDGAIDHPLHGGEHIDLLSSLHGG